MCSLLPFQEKCDECCFLICFILQTSSNHILLNISLPAEKKRNPVGTALSRRTRMLLFSSLTPQAKRESLPFSKQLPRPFLLDLYLHAFKDIRQSVSLFNLPARSQLYMFVSRPLQPHSGPRGEASAPCYSILLTNRLFTMLFPLLRTKRTIDDTALPACDHVCRRKRTGDARYRTSLYHIQYIAYIYMSYSTE